MHFSETVRTCIFPVREPMASGINIYSQLLISLIRIVDNAIPIADITNSKC